MLKDAENEIQNITNSYSSRVDGIVEAKEQGSVSPVKHNGERIEVRETMVCGYLV